jgi:hypothetical protein
VLRFPAENKVEFDFGQEQKNDDGTIVEVDFTGQEPIGKCPKCGARIFEGPMNYVCEKSVGANRSCDFRTGKIILQRPIDRSQVQKLLETGKTDLLDKFISKKGRPFKAFLVVKDGGVKFEFEPRAAKSKTRPAKADAPPEPKHDFTGQQPVGKCPKCSGKVFETETGYLCEKSQAEKRPCKFKIGKTILQQPIERAQAAKLLADGRTGLLDKFVSSKTGRGFSAYLQLDENGKVTFDFPPRETLDVKSHAE